MSDSLSHMLALTVPPFVEQYAPWLIAGVIVLVGLFIYGLPDLLRLSPLRVYAIASVCFRDAIRRRVLWITPLAMLGIVVVSQLQKPIDEQDAIRQTIKFCFFTTGLVVTVITIITAVTNLPREIENRVVFTIVTKPVTRFEIVLGKIAGFAGVSALILIIMGVFSLSYLNLRSYLLGRQITQTLQSAGADQSNRVYLEHFQKEGLLFSQTVAAPKALSQYARIPTSANDRVIQGGMHDAVTFFSVQSADTPNAMAPTGIAGAPPGALGATVVLNVGFEKLRAAPTDAHEGETQQANPTPTLTIQFMDARTMQVVVNSEQVMGQTPATLADPTGQQPTLIQLSPEVANKVAELKEFVIQVIPSSQDFLYRFGDKAIGIVVPDSQQGEFRRIDAVTNAQLRGSEGRSGQQLHGPDRDLQPVAIYQFRGVETPNDADGQVPFEMTVSLETGGGDNDADVQTTVEVRVYDRPNKKFSDAVLIYPENRRTIFFSLPHEYVKNTDFDIVVANKTPGHVVSLTGTSLQLVAKRGSFAWNFFLGSVVLWLLSILAATIALCCSTFLSWPIAAVLTVLIILGRWGVSNLDIGSGLGAQFANEFFPNSAEGSRFVNSTVEGLTGMLTWVARFMPDITPFGVTEQIERGVTISGLQMLEPLLVLVLFGLPLLTASYVFLRNKEVAP